MAVRQQKTDKRIALLLAILVGAGLGVAGTAALAPPADVAVQPERPGARRTPTLGTNRQELLDALAGTFTWSTAVDKPGLYVVKLDGSGATVAIEGEANEPRRASVTTIYTKDSAPHLATAAGLVARAVIGDVDWYGKWAGTAIHKCEPGFDIVGTHRTADTGVAEVRMTKLVVGDAPTLSISFCRLRSAPPTAE